MRSKLPVARAAILALLTMPALSCNNPPAPEASHPPAADLHCPAEPDIVALLIEDPSGLAFDKAVRTAGEECRLALARVCRWHQERGAFVTCPEAIEQE